MTRIPFPVGCRALLCLLAGLAAATPRAGVPAHHVDPATGVHLHGVGPGNPIVYDNDWWFDVFDNNYLWARASLGEADLRANIVSRDMWNWNTGYQYPMAECMADARKAVDLARRSGLAWIPDPVPGADRALERPDSGEIGDTVIHPTEGSRRIVDEARRATPEKPLVVIAGGPLTTVANALLADPGIASRLVVFSLTVSNHGYNGKDAWSAYVVARRTRLVDWGAGAFWDRDSVFTAADFAGLPANPFCDDLRRLIASDLGRDNQLGDGAPLVWLWESRCWRGAEERHAHCNGRSVEFVATGPDRPAQVLCIPKTATDLRASRDEYFRVLRRPELFR